VAAYANAPNQNSNHSALQLFSHRRRAMTMGETN
jgi:hypothetical protein